MISGDIGLLCVLLQNVLYVVFVIKMLDKVRKILSYWYLQYELVTCLYVFEPWEKKLLSILFNAECCLIVILLFCVTTRVEFLCQEAEVLFKL